jgi:hypothetical protein
MQVQRTALGECQAYVFKLILIKTVFPVTDKGVKTSQATCFKSASMPSKNMQMDTRNDNYHLSK